MEKTTTNQNGGTPDVLLMPPTPEMIGRVAAEVCAQYIEHTLSPSWCGTPNLAPVARARFQSIIANAIRANAPNGVIQL